MAEAMPLLELDLDRKKIKRDFENYISRMRKLCPIVSDTLKHLDAVSGEYFGGNKSLLVSPEDEEFIRSALDMRRKPTAIFLGHINCGKSSLLNEMLHRSNLVPTSQLRCTARLVILDYVKCHENESFQLVKADRTPIGPPQSLVEEKKKKRKKRKKGEGNVGSVLEKVIPKDLIDLPEVPLDQENDGEEREEMSRENLEAVQQMVLARVNADILKYGIHLVDAPGFEESDALDNLFLSLIKQDLEPLIVYVIDGRSLWRGTDTKTLLKIKASYPEANVLFVINKIDVSKKADKINQASDDEEEEPAEEVDRGIGKVTGNDDDDVVSQIPRLAELKVVLEKIKEKGFLGPKESLHTSEWFHCVSAKMQHNARQEGNVDPSNEYIARFQRFEACFLMKMYERMKHLEERVINRIITLMDAFLTLFGKQRVRYIAAVNNVPDFVERAMCAEAYLRNAFSSYVDDIIKNHQSIANTLEETKKKVKTSPVPLDLAGKPSIADQKMYHHLWSLFDVEVEEGREDKELQGRTKAASNALQIFESILCMIPDDIVRSFENKMHDTRGRFFGFVKHLRELLSNDCLNNLFEQAYKIRNKSDETPTELSSMRDIMSLKPVINAAQVALCNYVEEGLRGLTREDLHLKELTNLERWRDQFIESIFNRIKVDAICGKLVRLCAQKMEEMHKEFIRNIRRMEQLQNEVEKLGDEKLASLGKKVKPPLFLYLCEVYSVQYEREHGDCIELGEEIGQDGCYMIHKYPGNDELVVYVLKKEACQTEEEWMKRAVDLFHAYDIKRQTDLIHKGGPHPYKSSLVNCHGLWMPDRETFHVLFDKTDETVVEYIVRENPSLKQRLLLALEVGHGLELLHQIQYVHLDLRPCNIRMRGSQPKLHLCHWQSPLEYIKLQPDASGACTEVPPFHLHHSFTDHYERTDTTCDLDCYSFGTLLWILCEGSFNACPQKFQPYLDYGALQMALKEGILPEMPEGSMAGEREEHRMKLYELMTHLWTQPVTYTMKIANNRLEFLTGICKDSGKFSCYFDLDGNSPV